MKDTDIIAAIAPDAVSLMDKAIAEIKRLRQENATLTAEHDALRAERDEARRMYCEAVILHGTAHRVNESGGLDEIINVSELAQTMGWDCYKENTDAQGQ